MSFFSTFCAAEQENSLDRDVLDRAHDRRTFRFRGRQAALYRLLCRLSETLEPAHACEARIIGPLAQACSVARIAFRKQRPASVARNVEHAYVEFVIIGKLGNLVFEQTENLALGRFRQVVGSIDQNHRNAPGPVDRAQRGCIKFWLRGHGKVEQGQDAQCRERKEYQRNAADRGARAARVVTLSWLPTGHACSPGSGRQFRDTSAQPHRKPREWPELAIQDVLCLKN